MLTQEQYKRFSHSKSQCDQCCHKGGAQATQYGKCLVCGEKTVRDFAPVYKICINCWKEGQCSICGGSTLEDRVA